MTHNLMSQPAVTHAISHGSLPQVSVSDQCVALFLTMPLARCRLIHRVGAKPQWTYALREQGGRRCASSGFGGQSHLRHQSLGDGYASSASPHTPIAHPSAPSPSAPHDDICLTCANVAVVDKVSCYVPLRPMVAPTPEVTSSGVPCEPESAVILGVWTPTTQWGSL
jgi:hypothetical protein